MFLSKLILNPKCNQVRSELAQPYEMHRTIMTAYPYKRNNNEPFGVLFRIDENRKNGKIILLVQTQEKPYWEYIIAHNEKYLLEEPEIKEIDEIFSKISNGNIFRFRLCANPSKKIKDKKGQEAERSLRIGLYKESEQEHWIRTQKAKDNGFKILNLTIIPQGYKESKKFKNNNPIIKHFSVLYEGVLQVTDKNNFVKGLKNGIGSAKAFGFGLLSIAPYLK